MKKVALHSFGCRTNQEEMTAFAADFKSAGYNVVDGLQDADIIVVNSCSVTGVAENKNRRFIQSLSKKYPRAEICVTGCLAQQKPDDIAEFPQVKWVVGNAQKSAVPSLIAHEAFGIHTEEMSAESEIAMPTILETPEEASKTRFSLKIQEGCNQYCSFCIVPSLRGPSRSVPFDVIINTAQKAVELGYREIVLTGTHIGQFKSDGKSFIDIMLALLSLDETLRIRMSSMNPADLTDELFDLMRKEERVCRHVHVSAQSLSPKVLKLMKRSPRALSLLFERVQKLKVDLPEVTIGGDIIVGFPGEDEEDFQATLTGVKNWQFSYCHVFKYSPRPGTVAAEIDDQISGEEKNRRSSLLREQIQLQQRDFYKSLVGSTERVVVEKSGELKGITGNYIKVSGPKSIAYAKNRLVPIRFSEYDNETHKLTVIAGS